MPSAHPNPLASTLYGVPASGDESLAEVQAWFYGTPAAQRAWETMRTRAGLTDDAFRALGDFVTKQNAVLSVDGRLLCRGIDIQPLVQHVSVLPAEERPAFWELVGRHARARRERTPTAAQAEPRRAGRPQEVAPRTIPRPRPYDPQLFVAVPELLPYEQELRRAGFDWLDLVSLRWNFQFDLRRFGVAPSVTEALDKMGALTEGARKIIHGDVMGR